MSTEHSFVSQRGGQKVKCCRRKRNHRTLPCWWAQLGTTTVFL